jgi:hypothetical protein
MAALRSLITLGWLSVVVRQPLELSAALRRRPSGFGLLVSEIHRRGGFMEGMWGDDPEGTSDRTVLVLLALAQLLLSSVDLYLRVHQLG